MNSNTSVSTGQPDPTVTGDSQQAIQTELDALSRSAFDLIKRFVEDAHMVLTFSSGAGELIVTGRREPHAISAFIPEDAWADQPLFTSEKRPYGSEVLYTRVRPGAVGSEGLSATEVSIWQRQLGDVVSLAEKQNEQIDDLRKSYFELRKRLEEADNE